MTRPPPSSTLFPYTTLFRSRLDGIPVKTEDSREVSARIVRIVFERVGADRVLTEGRSEEHTSELQSRFDLVCRLLLEKKKQKANNKHTNKHQSQDNHQRQAT